MSPHLSFKIEVTVTAVMITSIFVVRRIGMTKPPVKLGVGKKFL
mgnify:CR=1 FL=1